MRYVARLISTDKRFWCSKFRLQSNTRPRTISGVLQQFHPFALSLILGLLIGAEREYHHRTADKTLGIRTFPLISLGGTLAAYIGNLWLAALVALAAFALVVLSYWRSTRVRSRQTDIGLTTEIAAVVVFCMGYVLLTDTAIGGLIGLATLALLISRGWLHKFVREKMRRNELTAAVVLIIAIFGVAPYLPDHAIDPWRLFNPRRLVILFCLIGLLQFSGYAVIRIFGARAGLVLSGFLGGFVSSTGVFISLGSTLQKYPAQVRSIMASGVLAVVAMVIELAIIVFVSSRPLFFAVLYPLLTIVVAGFLTAAMLVMGQTRHSHGREMGEPLSVLAILKLGTLLAALIAVVDLVNRRFHDAGLWLVAGISGLFELHGVSLAIAVDLQQGSLEIRSARVAIFIAVAAAFVSKGGILFFTSRRDFALQLAVLLTAMLAPAVAATLFF